MLACSGASMRPEAARLAVARGHIAAEAHCQADRGINTQQYPIMAQSWPFEVAQSKWPKMAHLLWPLTRGLVH